MDQERVMAFRVGFLTKLAQLGVTPTQLLERVKKADLTDLLSSLASGTAGVGQTALSHGLGMAGDVASTGLTAAALAPVALGGLTGASAAMLDSPSLEDIDTLRQAEIAATYERLAKQIRARAARKVAA